MEIGLVYKIIHGVWYAGIVISLLCLAIQTFLYVTLPSSRKLDQKILTQMTIARLLSIIFEYGSIYEVENMALTCVTVMLLFHSDAALACWMSVFTKRLYDKLVVVFADDMSFLWLSIGVWLLTLPVGLIAAGLMLVETRYVFSVCSAYCIGKCIVLTLNLLVFCRIFYAVFKARSDKNIRKTLKICINSFLLISATSLQVFIRFFYTDSTPFFVPSQHNNERNSFLIVFGLLSIYQVMAMTLIFVRCLSGSNKSDQTIFKQISVKIRNKAVIV